MNNEVRIVNLINGLVLVGEVEFNEFDDVVIANPLEVSAKSIADEGGRIIGEHMVLKPHLVMTDDTFVEIGWYNIISTQPLAKRLYPKYNDMVQASYYSKSLNESLREDSSLDDLDTAERKKLQDVVDSILDNLNDDSDPDPDKKLH